jgi:hypothetical protein
LGQSAGGSDVIWGAEDDQMFAPWGSGVKINERNILRNLPLKTLIASHSRRRGKLLSHREFKRYWIVGGHIVLILM